MQMNITESAEQKLVERLAGKSGFLKLIYDIEGCGCGVNGVPVLWLVKELSGDEAEIVAVNQRSIYMEKDQQVFFAEKMTLDFSEKANCFQLKSPGEYLNPRLSLVDTTK
ncbi:iron-sulfur cluster biosynthesis family protein [Bacillus sp. DNRA2]|uniref:iron-sulfur cluster biosynthesis family protein n=1 Tax=Bacillus sp. DNRA2 TaxID=2723053 RepID=UPI00145E01D0|nr:iron-sulfur cluster biosynthesis family protein [Bacillus sp. DNRA2]NMD70236.1 iron-sulfur cluster biosynthesis family protein [Bacillus sp. DNRA2]